MAIDKRELHSTRLSTTDELGNRVFVHPEIVDGFWRKRRSIFYSLLVLIYLIAPWTKISGKQTILLNLLDRHFIFFGQEFFAHDGVYLFFFMASGIFLFGFLTTIGGRLWCGWACPQTVLIDGIFRRIEIFIEGNSRQRKNLDEQKMNKKKLLKKLAKWLCFILVSLVISHSFLAYFVGSYPFIEIAASGPQSNMSLFITAITLTGFVLFNFGWFREQFCLIACPYGRFQSVMMDEHSLIVGYDVNRGEPRKGVESNNKEGDCVNCFQCVKVCPTGIDIRRGTQLECIACTACIDACDDIMERVGKLKGLIRYTNEALLQNLSFKLITPRRLIYLAMFVIFSVTGVTLALNSKKLEVVFMRATRTPYKVTQIDEQRYIVNHYRVDLRYKKKKELKLQFRSEEEKNGLQIVIPQSPIHIKNNRNKIVNIFFKFPRSGFLENGRKDIEIEVYDDEFGILKKKEIPLVGPFN